MAEIKKLQGRAVLLDNCESTTTLLEIKKCPKNIQAVLFLSYFCHIFVSMKVKDELFNMTRAWNKEKSESPTGIEPMTSRTPGRRSIH